MNVDSDWSIPECSDVTSVTCHAATFSLPGNLLLMWKNASCSSRKFTPNVCESVTLFVIFKNEVWQIHIFEGVYVWNPHWCFNGLICLWSLAPCWVDFGSFLQGRGQNQLLQILSFEVISRVLVDRITFCLIIPLKEPFCVQSDKQTPHLHCRVSNSSAHTISCFDQRWNIIVQVHSETNSTIILRVLWSDM